MPPNKAHSCHFPIFKLGESDNGPKMSFLEKGKSQAVGLETLRGHCVSVLFVASQSSVYHTLGEENVLGMQGWAFVVIQDLDSARFVLQ